MRTNIIILLGLILWQHTAALDSAPAVDGHWEIDIFDQVNDRRTLGGIRSLTAPNGLSLFAGEDCGLFTWETGAYQPSGFQLERSSDGAIIIGFDVLQADGLPDLPVKLQLKLTPTQEEIRCEAIISAQGTARLEDGIALRLPLGEDGKITFGGVTGDTCTYLIVNSSGRHLRKPFHSIVTAQDSRANLSVLLRNPLIPTPKLDTDGMTLELLIANEPNSSRPEGLRNICSILEAGDTVRVWWSIAPPSDDGISISNRGYVAFSPHPDAAEQTVMFAFDDIPLYESGYRVPAGPDDPHTPSQAALMNYLRMFPDVKFVWLVLTDGIQRLGRWTWRGTWWPPTANFSPDSSRAHSGGYSARADLSESDGSAVIIATPAVEPGRDYTVGAHVTAESAQPVTLQVSVLSASSLQLLAQEVVSLSANGWYRLETPFNSAEFGAVLIRFRFQGHGSCYLDDVTCASEDDVNRITNPGMEDFRPFYYYRSGDEPVWPNARGPACIGEEMSSDYLQWLKDLQDGNPQRHLASRIGLGLHGLHHTPDSTFTQGGYPHHEFDLYDPVGDSLRINRIIADLIDAGLEPKKIFNFFRFPGHRATESVLKPVMLNDCRIIDHGIFEPPVSYFGRIFRHRRQMWQTNTTSWHDQMLPSHLMQLQEVLDHGGFALMGGHTTLLGLIHLPHIKYNAIQLFDWLEAEYPYLKWMKANELCGAWDDFAAMSDVVQEHWGNRVTLSWSGSLRWDQTAVVYLGAKDRSPVECRIDGMNVEFEQRGRRIFIPLPSLDNGRHLLEVDLEEDIPAALKLSGRWDIRFAQGGRLHISHYFANPTSLRLMLFDVTGRTLFTDNNLLAGKGYQTVFVRMGQLPAGLYFARLEWQDGTVVRTVVKF